MPYSDDPDDEDLSEIFFSELGEDDGEDDALSRLSKGLGRLSIKERANPGLISFRINSRP